MTRRKKILVADLLCGAGGSSTGCKRALDELGLDMELVCVNHWPTAIETHQRNHPEARHYVQDISTVRPHLLVPEGYLDLLMASPTCFAAGTLILTKRGLLPIETIKVGDRVLTHKGRWRPVTSTMSAQKDTIVVRGHGHYGIETTAEHPFLICNRRPAWRPRRFIYGDPFWAEAGGLRPGEHFWATPTTFQSLAVPTISGDRTVPQTEAFWWFVGRWLGDGYFAERAKPRAASILICCANSEADELERRLNFAPPTGLRAGDKEIRWHRAKQATGVRFETNHTALANWLRTHFGKLAHGKRLPAWALGMPEEHRLALLNGYMSADGWADRRKREAYTVSKRLAIGLRLLAESLGHRVALHRTKARQNPIEGRKVSQRDQYHLVWVHERKHQQGGESDRHSWLPIKSVTHGKQAVPVFNISVEEDESYVAEGIVVHNCTHHSVARGGKPTSDQQRSDPWHIITWLTELRVKRIIVENVWEFVSWGPVDRRTGKPVKSRKGEYFHAWIRTLQGLGFTLEWRKLNAADYGDATTRQRFILMGRSDGRKVSWPMPTHQRRSKLDGDLFSTLQPWKPAREIIDWTIKGRSIFTRAKDLAPKTIARIYDGATRYNWPEPYLVILRNHMASRGLDLPLPTIAAGGTHIGLAEPVLLSQHNSGSPRSTSDPLPTITTGGAASESRPGCARPMLVEPFVMSPRHSKDGAGPRPRSVDEPVPTITAGGSQMAVVEPFVLSRHAEGAPRSVEEPTPTQVAKHSHVLIAPYYGSGSGETCQSAKDPLPTVTVKGRFGLVVPVTHTQGGNSARDVSDPVPTMTTAKGGEFAVVMPVTHAGDGHRPRDPDAEPLPTITGANRGELALAEATEHYDILFRMLEPHELAAAMGFNEDDRAYQFAGTKTDQIKQIGNAVSVAKMKACVGAIMADAAPDQSTKPDFKEAAE